MPRLRKFVAASDRYTSSSRSSGRPAKRDSPPWIKAHFASAVSPGARLAVAIAPALTIGFIAVDPDPFARRLGADRLTDQREDKRLGDATAITELNGSPVQGA